MYDTSTGVSFCTPYGFGTQLKYRTLTLLVPIIKKDTILGILTEEYDQKVTERTNRMIDAGDREQ